MFVQFTTLAAAVTALTRSLVITHTCLGDMAPHCFCTLLLPIVTQPLKTLFSECIFTRKCICFWHVCEHTAC